MFRKARNPDLSRHQVQDPGSFQGQLHKTHTLKWNHNGELCFTDLISVLETMRRADTQSISNNYCDIR